MSKLVVSTMSEVESDIFTALQLPVDARREIALALLWSLPRDEVVQLHSRIACMLQKDIVGLLPPELACQILSFLDVDQILQCGLVSKTWSNLCNEQALWASLCQSNTLPIKAAETTWADLTTHRQLLHDTAARLPPSPPFEGDEGSYSESSEDDRTGWDVIGLQGGMGGGGGLDPLGMSGGLRRTVWERGGVLPTHIANFQSKPTTVFEEPVILSHLPVPTPNPQPNYKHLYIVNQILLKRMGTPSPTMGRRYLSDPPSPPRRHRLPTPRVLDDISSSRANGLPGHNEVIYSLELVHRHMKIAMPNTGCADCMEHTVETDGNFFAPITPRVAVRRRESVPTVVTGRDWLLSGSRDRTLRLWHLTSLQPRVVKVFKGGHNGSILSHFVIDLPVKERRGSRSTVSPGSSRAPKMRAMAFSGGSDGTIAIWDLEDGDGPEEIIEAHTSSVLCLKGDDERFVSCSKDQTIKVFDIYTRKELLMIGEVHRQGFRNPVNSVNLSKDYIVSSSGDKSIKIHDIRTGNLLAVHQGSSQGFGSIDFDPTPLLSGYKPSSQDHIFKGTIIGGKSDGSMKSFHLIEVPFRTGQGDVVERVGDLTIQDMLALDDETEFDDVEMETDDRPVVEYNRTDRRALVLQDGPAYWAECVCQPRKANTSLCSECHTRPHRELVRSLKLGERYTISGSYDTHVKIWDRQSGRLLADLSGVHSGRIFAVVADRMRIVSSGIDNRIVVWDFSDGLDTSFVQA